VILLSQNDHRRLIDLRELDLIEIFGVDRCMLASNFPVDKVWASLDRLMEAFEASTADLSTAEQRKLFHDNAERTYRL